MKKIIPVICLLFLALTSCQQAKQKVFELMSTQLNSKCPMTMDEVTRMDSTAYNGTDNVFSYYYTLSGAADNMENAEAMKSQMEKILPEELKKTEEMKAFKEMNVTLDYVYCSASSGQELFKIKITSAQY